MRLDEKMIASIVEEVLREIGMGSGSDGRFERQSGDREQPGRFGAREDGMPPAARRDNDLHDITSQEEKAKPTLAHPMDQEALTRMMGKTTARIGVGKAGPRERTRTWLTLRADHALARDSVFSDVDEGLVDRLKLVSVQSMCRDRNEHITRPDLGRKLDQEAQQKLVSACKAGVDVQLIASDGLSSKAIEANLENILPVIEDGLSMRGISTGPAIFVKFGRVAVEDAVSRSAAPQGGLYPDRGTARAGDGGEHERLHLLSGICRAAGGQADGGLQHLQRRHQRGGGRGLRGGAD